MAKKILLVDDEIEIRGFMQDYFEDREYQVSTASNGEEALKLFEKESFDLIVCDMLMPKMIGVEFLRRVKEKKPDQRVIMMTGVREESMMEKAKALGCLHYLNKPVRLSDIEAKVAECFNS
jgi:DNA-binding NtrC family response regulator